MPTLLHFLFLMDISCLQKTSAWDQLWQEFDQCAGGLGFNNEYWVRRIQPLLPETESVRAVGFEVDTIIVNTVPGHYLLVDHHLSRRQSKDKADVSLVPAKGDVSERLDDVISIKTAKEHALSPEGVMSRYSTTLSREGYNYGVTYAPSALWSLLEVVRDELLDQGKEVSDITHYFTPTLYLKESFPVKKLVFDVYSELGNKTICQLGCQRKAMFNVQVDAAGKERVALLWDQLRKETVEASTGEFERQLPCYHELHDPEAWRL